MGFLNHWLLTILLLVPFIGAIAVLFVRPSLAMRWTALGTTLAGVCLSLLLMVPFKWQRSGAFEYGKNGTVQMLGQREWLPEIHSSCKVALDGLSFPLILLTTIICSAACAASFNVSVLPRRFFSLLLLFEATILGVFLAFDLLLFYAFLLFSIVPAFLLIGNWGGDDARRAARRFLMYMLAGMACLLVAFWGVHLASRAAFVGGTFDLIALTSHHIPDTGRVMFLLALVGFAIRLPMVPFQGWFSDVMSEAPGPIAALIGALIPITGGYGLLRIAWPLFAQQAMLLWLPVAILGVITILVASLRALVEQEIKRSIAYAMTSMIGFVLLGMASTTPAGMNGAVVVLLSHGLITATAMLLLGGVSPASSGRFATAPIRIAFFIIVCVAAMIVPGLLGVGSCLLGMCQAARPDSLLLTRHLASAASLYLIAIIASLGIVLGGAWATRANQQAFLAPGDDEAMADLTGREISYLTPLAVIALLLGLFPMPLCFTFTQPALDAILQIFRGGM